MTEEIEKLSKDAFVFLREECCARQLPFDLVLQEQIKGLMGVASTCLDQDSQKRLLIELEKHLD